MVCTTYVPVAIGCFLLCGLAIQALRPMQATFLHAPTAVYRPVSVGAAGGPSRTAARLSGAGVTQRVPRPSMATASTAQVFPQEPADAPHVSVFAVVLGGLALTAAAYILGRHSLGAMAAFTGKRLSMELQSVEGEAADIPLAPAADAAPKKKPAPAPAAKVEINNGAYFDIRVGKIVEVGIHPNAEGLYLEKIDVGEAEPRQIISGLVQHVPIDKMQGAMVLVMCNLKPAKLRELMSYGMVMCASQTNGDTRTVQLVQIPEGAKPGDRVTFPGLVGQPVEEMPKKRAEKLLPDFRTNEEGVCCWQNTPLTLEAGVIRAALKSAHLG